MLLDSSLVGDITLGLTVESDPSPPPSAGRYRCLVVDPPWDQGKTGERRVRPNQGTALDYPTMTIDEIASVPVPNWAAPESFLMLWATNSRSKSTGRPILLEAFELMERWGFRYYTTLTWDKSTGPCPFGPFQITTEHCLVGYRGKFVVQKHSLGKMKTLFKETPVKHSQKPRVFYEDIARYFFEPRLDVFGRRRHQGFDTWGDEVEPA